MHKKHEISDISEVSSKLKFQLQTTMKECEKRKKEILDALMEIATATDEVNKQQLEMSRKISDSIAELISKLKQREAELQARMKILVNEKLELLSKQRGSLQLLVTEIDSQILIAKRYYES